MYIPLLSDLVDVTFTHILLALCVLLVIVYLLYAVSYHGVWEKVGVPGPKPWPIIDHKFELRQGIDVAMDKWFKQYGDTFGCYGIVPHMAMLVTKDLSLIKQVLVKDFDNFSNRFRPMRTWSSVKTSVSSASGGTWKRHRHVTSPMFTGVKMKMMLKHVCASAQNLTHLAKGSAAKGELVSIKHFVAKFSTEVIARVGFGVETHAASKDESEFAFYSRSFVNPSSRLQKFVTTASYFFPPIENILKFLKFDIDFINKKADDYFVSILKSTMQDRKVERNNNGELAQKARDMLDLLMDAAVEDDDARLADSNSRTLSHSEVIGNSTILILAGVETVSTAFQSILYCLAFNPDVQDKVIEEIDRVLSAGQTIEYEHLPELKYSEQVINECLRLFPLITSIFRMPRETKTYDGVTIPEGTMVQIPIAKIMQDPQIWPDPEKFDPDRFSPENKATRDPIAFLPFGYGPRICLGQRLAMMELKVVLAYLLREVRFVLSDRTYPKKGERAKRTPASILARRFAKPIELEVIARS